MPVLKDTEASLDIGCEKYAAPEMFTGEHASIKHILDKGMACLRPAELEIECGLGHVVSKPVVSPVQLDKEKYNDQFGLGEYLVETEENLVPSLTKEDQYTMKLIKINAYEFIETQQKSKESAPLIQKIEHGINNEVRDQEIAPMQLVPVRREIFSKLNVNRVGPLPIIPENKHILSGMSMSPRCHEAVPMPETASTPLVEALPQIFRKDFPIDHMDGILELNTHLAVRLAKFELAQDDVEYCGHVVGLGKQSPAQLKARTMIYFSILRYKTQVKVLGYERQYIPMFSRLAVNFVTSTSHQVSRWSCEDLHQISQSIPKSFYELKNNLIRDIGTKVNPAEIYLQLSKTEKTSKETHIEYFYRIKEIASRINMEEAEKYYIVKGLKENRSIEIQLQSCSNIEELKEKIKLLDIQEKSKSNRNEVIYLKYPLTRIPHHDNSMEDGTGEIIHLNIRIP
ncbi:uncharacterized protein TNCV_4191201 [Trichonephila clavipes]|nr:uncharacterized protein TNCV_4191201 [Trichonephila clavipes]